MPAYGFYIRHVKGIQMRNVELRTLKDDARPAFVLDNVEHADFIHVRTQGASAGRVFALKNVRDFSLDLSRPAADIYLASAEEERL